MRGVTGWREKSVSYIECFVDFLFNFLFEGIGKLEAFADEPTLRDADIVRTPGVGGTVVVGGCVREVGMDGDGAVAGGGLDGTTEVACGTGEDLATTSSTFDTLQATLDLLPCTTEEGFLLEIILEHANGDVAQFYGEVVFELAF